MDLDAVNADSGDEIEGIKQKKFQLDTGAARLNLPGLIDGIVGMKVGDEREFPLTMPSDWPQEFIRGVTANFTVKVLELFENEVPEASDAIAGQIYPDATTVDGPRLRSSRCNRRTPRRCWSR